MAISDAALAAKRLGEILVEEKLISSEQLEYVLKLCGGNGRKIQEVLIDERLITPLDLAKVQSAHLKVPFVDLKMHKVHQQAIRLVPEAMARKYDLLPLAVISDSLVVVMADPENLQAIEGLAAQTKMRIESTLGILKDIREGIDLNYKASGEIEEQISRIAPTVPQEELAETRISAEAIAQAPIVRAVNLLIAQAVKDRASDIHIEPQGDRLRIRYRIDGILHDMMSLPLSVHPSLISRVKILADMNIAERRHPQDGQFSIKVGDKEVDIRAATFSTIYGEMAVLRVLDKSLTLFSLPELGFLSDALEKYQRVLKSPFGMILIGGPTGSGKTTTLYASINQLDRNERNILTIEDPVEYVFPDINPSQINPRAGITFAEGLRAIMRLDPDVILVGEIRDTDTAKIAIQAALTGHLVLSSIHANDAVGILFRLLDLGAEPFLVASALVSVVSQRMVRRVCPYCKTMVQPSPEERAAYEEEMGGKHTEFYYGTGCNFCANTGYLGRTGVFEVLIVSEEIKRMLLAGASVNEIQAQAVKEGMVSMRRDGMLKVQEGITTPYEVLRCAFSI